MPMPRTRRSATGVVALAAVVFLPGCGATQPTPVPEADVAGLEAICSSEALEVEIFEEDAQSYADDFGVSLEEARDRLALQGVGDLHGAGMAAAPELWAGSWLEHEPEFGYVLFYKGEEPDVAHVQAAVADCSIPIIVRSGATISELELLAGMERLTASGRLEPPMPALSMYPDVRSGAIVLGGPIDPGPEVLARIEELAGVPVRYVEEALPTTQ